MSLSIKTCKFCNETKSIQEFNKHPKMTGGRLNKCKSCEKEYKRRYYQANKDGVVKKARERNQENYKLAKRSQKYKDVRNASRRKRYREDLEYKITCILRSRLRIALKKNQKKSSTVKYIGCSIQKLKEHIEAQFQDGMSWDNWKHDVWHLDHIKPLSSFDLSDDTQILEACNYTNLRPLWAGDNVKKGAKV